MTVIQLHSLFVFLLDMFHLMWLISFLPWAHLQTERPLPRVTGKCSLALNSIDSLIVAKKELFCKMIWVKPCFFFHRIHCRLWQHRKKLLLVSSSKTTFFNTTHVHSAARLSRTFPTVNDYIEIEAQSVLWEIYSRLFTCTVFFWCVYPFVVHSQYGCQ